MVLQCKSINGICHFNKNKKDKNLEIISTDAEKIPWQNKQTFTIKTLNKLGAEVTYLNIIKGMYDKPTTNIIINGEKLKAVPLGSWIRHGGPFSPFLFSIVLKVLARMSKQEKNNKEPPN